MRRVRKVSAKEGLHLPPPNVQLESLAIFEVMSLKQVVVFLAIIDPSKQILLAILQPSSPVYEVNELATPP